MEVMGGTIGNSSHPNAPNGFTLLLGRDDYQRLGRTAPSFVSRSTHLGFIHLDSAAEFIPAGSHHGPTQLVKDRPSRLIAAQTQNALQPKRTGSVLLTRHLPDRTEPKPQRQTTILKNGASGHAGLMATSGADQPPSLRWPTLPANEDPPGTHGTARPWRSALPVPKASSDSPQSRASTTAWGRWSQ